MRVTLQTPTADDFRVINACANECVHVHNEIIFPQAKLDSKINVFSLLSEVGDLYFLSHDNIIHIILFNSLKRKIVGRKKKIGESLQKNRTLECKL